MFVEELTCFSHFADSTDILEIVKVFLQKLIKIPLHLASHIVLLPDLAPVESQIPILEQMNIGVGG